MTDTLVPRKAERAGRRWASWLPLIVFAGFLVFRYFIAPTVVHTARPVQMAGLHLVDIAGQPIAPALYAGKAVVLNYWAPWCAPCRSEMPALQQLQNQNRQTLLVLGVLADDTQPLDATRFMQAHHLTYPVVQNSPALTAAFGAVSLLPTTFYISSAGKIVSAVQGATPGILMRMYARRALR